MANKENHADLKKATIHEAARIAGVSIASVSRALNNKPGISEKTREKILSICKELGYVPSSSARELSGNHTNTIAVSMGPKGKSASRYLGMIWPDLANTLRIKGKNLLSAELEDLDTNKLGGVVLLGVEEGDERIEFCKQHEVPYVCIGMVQGSFWVAPDDFLGARLGVEHLVKKGCSKVPFVTSTHFGGGYRFRYQGYMSAMAEKGLSISEIDTGSDPVVEIAAYRHFLSIPKETLEYYDGFICERDETAIGIVAALKDRGYNIPSSFKVVGYDGLPMISDDLTTIVQDARGIAQQVCDLLEAAIKREPQRGVLVPVDLRLGKTS
ncbi:LacI family DNA-binding transcriptional regulator [Vibrio maerlii]|uniref:LacI family DNA-binding transcriptional regulator n=1 Tax=Vibrio maerlii TaxID=2231648 RepID=UPI000E3EC172|nr:LacI family DNA-binding transcriptional regulator [Vibrio maerlii]